MDKNSIRKFAIWAKTELWELIKKQLEILGFDEKRNHAVATDLKTLNNKLLSAEEYTKIKDLFSIKNKDYKQLIEEVANLWFFRFIALRFLEVNKFLPRDNKLSILSNKNKLISACDNFNSILPELFQKKDDYTNLLLSDDLFVDKGIIHRLITDIPEDDWINNVQIIGWLFQFYNLTQKNKVFEDLKKNIKISKEKIPFATQLFTPEWIVKYMVENSLGRLWIEGHKDTKLKDKWKYYLEEVKQNEKTQTELETIRKDLINIKPEKIKCIDPCMGSGNILCYLFDVLFQIYKESGYTNEDAVKSIIENNIIGLDIDEDVSKLAYFSIIMKAREYDEEFFSRKIKPKVYSIKESNDISPKLIDYFCNNSKLLKNQLNKLNESMKDAKLFGSLIEIPNIDFKTLYKRIKELEAKNSIYISEIKNKLLPLFQVAEILSKKYDIVITNPPYMGSGGMNQDLATFMKTYYPNTKADLFSAFLEHGLELATNIGYSCMVTMQNWMFIPSFEIFRKQLIKEHSITALLHMGNMVMGIAFGTSVSVIRKRKISNYIGVYSYLKQSDIDDDKPFIFPVNNNRLINISSEKFNLIPGSPIAYWASKQLLEAYKNNSIGDKYEACVGIQTGDNNRFLKYWFEVPLKEIEFNKNQNQGFKKRWYPHPKGGAFRKWFGNYEYVVNWQNNGEEIHKFNKSKFSIDKYNRNGICWSHTTNGAFSARIFNKSSIPNLENPVLFCDGKDQKYLLALLNSKVADYLLNMINSTMHYHVSDILNLPLLNIDNPQKIEIISDESIELVKSDWNSSEISWNFTHHPLYQKNRKLLSECYSVYLKEKTNERNKLIKNEEYLNKVFINLYGLERELSIKTEEKYISIKKVNREKTVKSFLSYVVGCIFGRYSLNNDGLICTDNNFELENYKSYIPEKNNIITICENKYFNNDIISKIEDFLISIYGQETLEDNLAFIAESIGGKGESRQIIRNYFLKHFFNDHCKTYQKRPIYWLFESGMKNAFKCLIYVHRYNPETIANIHKKYIIPLQNKYQQQINDILFINNDNLKWLEKNKRLKLIKHLQDQSEELGIYEKKMHAFADSKYNININDGIKHNYAIFKELLAKIR